MNEAAFVNQRAKYYIDIDNNLEISTPIQHIETMFRNQKEQKYSEDETYKDALENAID